MEFIEFHNVSYQNILHNITGAFKEKHITTLVGPSGAGKTTVLKHINGLITNTSGEIYYKGKNIRDINVVELRQHIGMAFQSAPMIEGTVYDNLRIPKTIFNEDLPKSYASSLMDMVDLSHISLDKNIKQLSGGERARVAIARTFVNQPDVLLLDEITASLDYRMVKEIERLVCKVVKEKGVTAIWITHDLDQARRVSDDMWFLHYGELIEYGDAQFIDESDNPYIKSFIRGEEQ